uniref:Uncharacterized protein n=1 Tax=Tanacetum cinerariifolium TaxID=118510 RepID=A0A699JYK5_TANCI|nr:hypothetical protein [Tanacetum cinerariifolium]
MDKRKRFKLTLEIFKDIMKISPRVQGQDFDTHPTDEEIVSFLRELIHKTVSWRNKIGLHTSKDDYLINTLRFIFAKEATQIYGAILLESLTSLEIKETKAYKTYLGFASGAAPPKKAQKFKKPASPQLSIVQVSSENLRKNQRE